ncbi:MAG: RlmE family RNA methyltransferase [Sandaracinaceae bacterium]|nr:RlmE family RNA methyltransferase [Sandaracinaceae bacterium]
MSGRRRSGPTGNGGGGGGGNRRVQDSYGRRAKADGFPARSVYKLEEIDQKVRLFRRGQRVLDLGAAPGSWTMYAATRVGLEGRVFGIDIQPHRAALPTNARIEVLDVHALQLDTLGAFDVVISDMAPNTTGARETDMYRSYELFMTALDVADRVLVPGGHFTGKIFQGKDFPDAQKAVRERYTETKVVRPKATRDESYEVFLVGLKKRAPVQAAEATPAPDETAPVGSSGPMGGDEPSA